MKFQALLITCVLTLTALTANAAEYYVATTGSDTPGNGSEASPWLTTSYALGQVADGDTIYMMPGSYSFGRPAKDRTTDYVTIAAKPEHIGQVQFNGYVSHQSVKINYLRFQNVHFEQGLSLRLIHHLEVRGCTAGGNPSLYGFHATGSDILIEGNVVTGGAKAYNFSGENIIVRYNEAHSTTSDGYFMGSGTNVLIEGNYFHDNVPSAGAHPDHFQIYGGTTPTVDNLTIRGNYFDTNGQGLFGEKKEGTIGNVLVENNIVISTHVRGWSIPTERTTIVRNNTFMFPASQLSDPSGGATFIYADGWLGGDYVFANNTCRYIANADLPHVTTTHYTVTEGSHAGPGTSVQSPVDLFEDYNNHDFRLASDSPARDAGTGEYASPTDIFGRPRDTTPDIGAIEYNAADNKTSKEMFLDILLAKRAEIQGLPAPTTVAGRHVFYNNSAFDDNNPAANAADDSAIATDKLPLLPGQTASAVNYTSCDKGINGIMVDLYEPLGTLTAADFQFNVGNSADPATWPLLAAPVTITTRPGAGVDGATRVTIIFPDNTIRKQWLKVTVRANSNTGLNDDDVFYFGNAVGDTLDQADNAIVDATDEINSRNDPRHFLDPAAITNPNDHNRDAKVNATDEIIARNNTTTALNALIFLTAP